MIHDESLYKPRLVIDYNSPSILAEYDKRNLNAIRPMFVTFDALLMEFRVRYPYFLSFAWFEHELHDLWVLGPPDPNPANEGMHLLLPGQVQRFAREIAKRVGVEIMKNTRGG